ncbi:MAG TPA: MFS transporter [Bacillota bacterium]
MQGVWAWIVLVASTRYLAFVTRMGIVPFYPELMERFGVTYTGAGALYTAFFVGYAGSMVPAGVIADRRPPLGLITAGLLLMTASGTALAFGGSFGQAVAARVLQGVGVALTITAVFKVVAAVFPRSIRGRAVALMEQASGLGMLTALTLLPMLAGWVESQWLLALQPALCLAAVALVPLVGRRAQAESAASTTGAGPLPPLRQFFGRDLAWLTLTSTLGLVAANGVLGWIPTYLTDGLGQDRATAGLVTGLILAGQLLGVYPAGTVSDRIGRRKPVLYTGTAMLAVSLASLLVVRGLALYASALLLGVGLAWAVAPMMMLTAEVFGPTRAGLMSSITVAASQVFSGFAGVLFGWLLDLTGGFTAVWLTATGLVGLRMLTLAGIREKQVPAGEAPTPPYH